MVDVLGDHVDMCLENTWLARNSGAYETKLCAAVWICEEDLFPVAFT